MAHSEGIALHGIAGGQWRTRSFGSLPKSECMVTMPNSARSPRCRSGLPGDSDTSSLEDVLRRKGVDEAWDALEEMQFRGVAASKFTISRMLVKTVGDGCVRIRPGRVYRAISLVEKFIELQPKDIDEVLFNALLDTCCRLKDLTRLEEILQRMHDLNVPPSPVTLGILVKSYGQTGDLQKVLDVWDEMKDQRKQANAVTFGCMIDACVKCGHLEKAIEIFEEMKVMGKHRNTILYTTLIKGYGLQKDLDHALALFEEMPAEGVPRNTITFNSLIDVCVKCGNLPMAEAILRDMTLPSSAVEPDLITFSTLLKGYCQFVELDKALQVLEAIKARGMHCDELVYNTLMDGCVKANDIPAGLGLLEEMLRNGLRPSTITHSILERLHHRAGCEDGEISELISELYMQHGFNRSGRAERVSNSVDTKVGGSSRLPRRRKRGSRGTKKAHSGQALSSSPSLDILPGSLPQLSRQASASSFGNDSSRNLPKLMSQASAPSLRESDVCYTSRSDATYDGTYTLSPLDYLVRGVEAPCTGLCPPGALFNVVWCSSPIASDQPMLTPTPALKFTPRAEAMPAPGYQAFMEPAWSVRMGGA